MRLPQGCMRRRGTLQLEHDLPAFLIRVIQLLILDGVLLSEFIGTCLRRDEGRFHGYGQVPRHARPSPHAPRRGHR